MVPFPKRIFSWKRQKGIRHIRIGNPAWQPCFICHLGVNCSTKNHHKKVNNVRERDKNKSVASESGGSSQCDTPPLSEKDGSSTQGKFVGVGADSILCIAEQVAAELTGEAAANLAEDVSYKLRQTISTISLHSEMMKKSCVDSWDVNTVLMLSDTSPVVGTTNSSFAPLGEEKLCYQTENLLNVTEFAMTSQTYVFSTLPSVSVEWITDDRSLSSNSNISFNLQNYYTKVARAILNLKKKPKQIAVEDLTTNTRIGPIFPNLFNLAVLVLNDDNLKALNVPAKKPLQSNVLDMVDALCSNPCSLDTNIQQQFQRLFPVMVSNILGNGSLAEKMVAILTKITRTWPSFIAIGKGILFDYLSQGTKERLTAPMIRCVTALGRGALVGCLAAHLDHLDALVHAPPRARAAPDLRETLLVSGQWPLFLLGVGAMFACTAASVGDAACEWTMAFILIGRWGDVCLHRGKCWRRWCTRRTSARRCS
ncbi:unnamed protein product, partial [Iphiclides podalirius]